MNSAIWSVGVRKFIGVFFSSCPVSVIYFHALLGVVLFSSPLLAAPLNIPDNTARETLRQQERQRQLRERLETNPDVRLQNQAVERPSDQFPEQESPCFKINKISLIGEENHRFKFALSVVTEGKDKAIGRCLGVEGINVVITRVQNAVVEKGFITTRVLVAPQDLKSGELVLVVIPGKLRNIIFESDAPQRLLKIAMPTSKGEILNLRDLEQGLENFKRVPTAEADFQIKPSTHKNSQLGDSDILIRYKQAFPLRASLSLDDGGATSTGRNKVSLTLSYDNPFSLNDLFYLSINRDIEGGDASAQGTDGYTVHYSLPIKNWLLSTTASKFNFRQTIANAAQTLRYSGESKTSELRLTRRLYRDGRRRTTGYVRAYLRSSQNFINDIEVSLQRRRTAGYEIGVNHREYIGNNTLSASIAWRRGTGAFSTLAAPEDPFNEGSSRPSLYTTNILLDMPFKLGTQQLRYNANFRWQHNLTPLVPQDRFFIGSRYSVRGFDGNQGLSADRGWFIRNDLSVALAHTGQFAYLGLDYGEVDGQSSAFLLGKHLAGGVIGLRGNYKKITYDVFAGKPISKPRGFRTAKTVYGFNLNVSF